LGIPRVGTKSTPIVLNFGSSCFTYELLEDSKESYFYSLTYDASNKGNMKVYPFFVQFLSTTGVKKGFFGIRKHLLLFGSWISVIFCFLKVNRW